jgi:hypothetical protein
MFLKPVLLVLPIVKHDEARYRAAERDFAKRKRADWARPDAKFRPGSHVSDFDISRNLVWGPWPYNDTIGWLEIGWDQANRLGGDVYLKWQCLARNVRQQVAPGEWKTVEHPQRIRRQFWELPRKHEVVWETEIQPLFADINDNASCVQTVAAIVHEARTHVRKRYRYAEVWLPPFGLECINWVEAIRQAKDDSGR